MKNHGYDFLFELYKDNPEKLYYFFNWIIGSKSISPEELDRLFQDFNRITGNVEVKAI